MISGQLPICPLPQTQTLPAFNKKKIRGSKPAEFSFVCVVSLPLKRYVCERVRVNSATGAVLESRMLCHCVCVEGCVDKLVCCV